MNATAIAALAYLLLETEAELEEVRPAAKEHRPAPSQNKWEAIAQANFRDRFGRRAF